MLSLHEAVAKNSIGQVQKLIDEGADVNELMFECFPHGKCTPLQVAAYKGYEEIAELLISNGALLEAKNQRGQTALCVAAFQKKNNVGYNGEDQKYDVDQSECVEEQHTVHR